MIFHGYVSFPEGILVFKPHLEVGSLGLIWKMGILMYPNGVKNTKIPIKYSTNIWGF